MQEYNDRIAGPVRVYSPEETRTQFFPVRERLFDLSDGGVGPTSDRVFRDDSWEKVVIRGSLHHSDRSMSPGECYETVEDWEFADLRDEMQPLFDLLIEGGVFEVVQISPFTETRNPEAIVTRPTGPAVRQWLYDISPTLPVPDRLLFDRTERWGFYASAEMFGLLGGEPDFMKRFMARSGGMEFIRRQADRYWEYVLNNDPYEGPFVPHYYELAGWDDPPRKRDENTG